MTCAGLARPWMACRSLRADARPCPPRSNQGPSEHPAGTCPSLPARAALSHHREGCSGDGFSWPGSRRAQGQPGPLSEGGPRATFGKRPNPLSCCGGLRGVDSPHPQIRACHVQEAECPQLLGRGPLTVRAVRPSIEQKSIALNSQGAHKPQKATSQTRDKGEE